MFKLRFRYYASMEWHEEVYTNEHARDTRALELLKTFKAIVKYA